MAKVSVIIPCYNQGHFLEEAVNSVLRQTFSDVEIIIVNDGSTDPVTNEILSDIAWPKTKVILTDNQGLAAARNNGIAKAAGQYILPLDADDVIEPTYIEKAADLLDREPKLGIVYCKARLFGTVDMEWSLQSYSLENILQDNVIFCSAMFRRSDWEAVGGYDTGMVYGWEDYEFWISLIERGRGVYQLPEVLFGYRVAGDSMVRSKEKAQKIAMFKRVYQRHQTFFGENIEVWLKTIIEAREPYYTARLYVDCGAGSSDETSMSRKVELKTPLIRFQLDAFDDIHFLRFDPVDVPAVIRIFKIVIEYKDGSLQEISHYPDNSILRDDEGYSYFDHNDPYYHLDLEGQRVRNASSLSVQLHFKALGEKALSKSVKIQKKLLEEHSRHSVLQACWEALKRKPSERMREYLKRHTGI